MKHVRLWNLLILLSADSASFTLILGVTFQVSPHTVADDVLPMKHIGHLISNHFSTYIYSGKNNSFILLFMGIWVSVTNFTLLLFGFIGFSPTTEFECGVFNCPLEDYVLLVTY